MSLPQFREETSEKVNMKMSPVVTTPLRGNWGPERACVTCVGHTVVEQEPDPGDLDSISED